MKRGKSLEDVFLDTRKSTTDNSYPMISTPEGIAINKDIYPNLTPYLYYYEADPNLDKMTNYLLEASTNGGLCTRKNQYDELQRQLESLRAASTLNMNKNIPEINRIKNLIAQYKEKQDRYISLARNWGTAELSHTETFSGTGTAGKKSSTMTGNFTWQQMIETDYDGIIKNVTNAKKSTKDPFTQAQFQSSIEMHSKARDKKNEILSLYPNLKDYKQKFKEQVNEMQGTYAIANQIALEERKLYDSMYSNLRSEKKANKQSSACKEFML
jgi:soluble cytochrome b562